MLPRITSGTVGWETLATTTNMNTTSETNQTLEGFDDIPRLVFFTGEVAVSLLCIFGNALVLEAIRRHRTLHTPTNMFIFNLAVSDFLVGLVVVPFHLIFNEGIVRLTFSQCLMTNSVILVVINVTILMLLVVALERFIATRFPFFYCGKVDMYSGRVVTVVVWLVSATLGMIPMMGWNVGPRIYQDDHNSVCHFQSVFTPQFMAYFQLILLFIVPLLIITFVYTYITFVVKKLQKAASELHARFNVKIKRDLKTTKIVAVVLTAFICLFLPLNILKLIYYLNNKAFCDYTGKVPGAEKRCEFPQHWLWFAIWLTHFHSVVNPIIYAIWNSNVNVAMKNVLFNRSAVLPNQRRGTSMRSDSRRTTTQLLVVFDANAKDILFDTTKALEDTKEKAMEVIAPKPYQNISIIKTPEINTSSITDSSRHLSTKV